MGGWIGVCGVLGPEFGDGMGRHSVKSARVYLLRGPVCSCAGFWRSGAVVGAVVGAVGG